MDIPNCPVCGDQCYVDNAGYWYLYCDCGFQFEDCFSSKETLILTYNSIREANK